MTAASLAGAEFGSRALNPLGFGAADP
jgi:hypothetical protein